MSLDTLDILRKTMRNEFARVGHKPTEKFQSKTRRVLDNGVTMTLSVKGSASIDTLSSMLNTAESRRVSAKLESASMADDVSPEKFLRLADPDFRVDEPEGDDAE